MTKYLLKRILHGLVSIVIVVAMVMIMIYTMLDRNLVFAGDTKYSHTSNNAREEESMNILTLKELRNTEVDMFSTVYIGNKMTKIIKHKMVTPRGYRYDRT